MRIVVWVPVPMYKKAILDRIGGASGVELIVIDDPKELGPVLDGAEGMISGGASKYTAEVAATIQERGTSLRWFQTVAAGNDGLATHGIRAGVTVTGSGGHNAPVVAEHAVALLLSIAHAVPDFVAYKGRHTWGGDFRQRYKSLYGQTATVLGFGHIGVEIAKRLKGFQIRVLSVTRSGSSHELADESFSTKELHAALAKSDAVMLALPLTDESRHIVNESALAAMRRSAYLVNVGRGGLIDQRALAASLSSGGIAGAAVDVTDPEPLPADDPLWDAPNLIISPHCGGGGSTLSPQRLADTVERNLQRFVAGKALENVLTFPTSPGASRE
jgi:phosphoglycerate dehydrogenase-like enzyme